MVRLEIYAEKGCQMGKKKSKKTPKPSAKEGGEVPIVEAVYSDDDMPIEPMEMEVEETHASGSESEEEEQNLQDSEASERDAAEWQAKEDKRAAALAALANRKKPKQVFLDELTKVSNASSLFDCL